MVRGSIVALMSVCMLLPQEVWAAPELTPDIFFQEVLWAGSDRSAADEWVELGNQTDAVIDLTGWYISRITAQGEQVLAALDGLVIAAHGSLLVANNDHNHQFTGGQSALAVRPDLIVPSLSLSNTQLELRLYRPEAAHSVLVDVAGSGKRPPAGTTRPPTSMERNLLLADGALSTSWHSSQEQRNVDADSVLVATPTHAGRPTILTQSLDPHAIRAPFLLEVTVADPDGEDDVQSVVARCSGQEIILVDTGLAGDRVAGDRIFSAQRERAVAETCLVSVTDEQWLATDQMLEQPVYWATAPIRLNEVLPAPATDSVESVEIANAGNEPVALTGWTLDDAVAGGSEPFDCSPIVVPAYGFVVLDGPTTKIRLNDDGDDVVLRNPEGRIVDQTSYQHAPKGWSWAFDGEHWQWRSAPSLTEPNPPVLASPSVSVPPVGDSPVPVSRVTVQQLRALTAGTPVELVATVLTTSGMVNTSTFLVADESGLAEVVLPSGTKVELAVGRRVQLFGRRSSTRRARVILDGYQVREEHFAVSPSSLSDGVNNASFERRFVRGSAMLIKSNRRSLIALAGQRQFRVEWSGTLPDAEFDTSLDSGSELMIEGILTYEQSSDEPTIMVRSATDLSVLLHPQSEIVSATDSSASIAQEVGTVNAQEAITGRPIVGAAAAESEQSVPPPPPVLSSAWLRTNALIVALALEARQLGVALNALELRRVHAELARWLIGEKFVMVSACFLLLLQRLLLSVRIVTQPVHRADSWPGG